MNKRCLLFTAVFLVASTALLSGVTTAADGEVQINLPDSVEVGEEFEMSVEGTAPDFNLLPEVDATISVYADGVLIEDENITIQSGEKVSFSFNHTFQSPGEKKVRGVAVIDEFSTQINTTEKIRVTSSTNQTDEVRGVTVEIGSLKQNTLSGQIESLVNKSVLNLTVRDELGLLYESDGTKWVVMADDEIETGRTVANGTGVGPGSIPVGYGVISAKSVTTDTQGKKVSLRELRNSPQKYANSLVRLETDYQQIAYILELSGGDILSQQAKGSFDTVDLDLLPPGKAAQWSAINLSSDSVGGSFDSEIGDRFDTPNIVASDVGDRRFWMDAEVTIDGVFRPSPFRSTFHIANLSIDSTDADLSSVVDGRHDGEVVTVEADATELQISTRETLLSVAPCGADSAVIGSTCLPVLGDTVTHAGVMYEGTPDERNDTLLYTGISNQIQDVQIQTVTGRFAITGEVVSTGIVAPNLDENESTKRGRALKAYNIERVGSAGTQPSSVVKEYRKALNSSVVEQIQTPQNRSLFDGVFEDRLVDAPGFAGPPKDTDEIDPELYEDLDGDGDGTDLDQTVLAFGKVVREGSLGLSPEQAKKFDWNENSPEDEVTTDDLVSLFAEQIRAD